MSSIASILFLSALSAAAPTLNMDASFDAGVAYGSGPNRVVKEIHLGSVNPTTESVLSNSLPVQAAYAAPQIQYKQSGSNSVYGIAAPQYVAPSQQGYQPNLYAAPLQTSVVVTTAAFVTSITTTAQTGTIQLATLSATTVAPGAQFASTSTLTFQTSSSTPTTAPAAFIPSQTPPPPQTTTQPQQQQLASTQPKAQYSPVYAQPVPIYAQPAPIYAQPVPTYAQPAPIYAQPPPPLNAQPNTPQPPKYQAPPTTTSAQPAPQVPIQPTTPATVSKPANLIPSSSSSTTTTCSETKAAPALISPGTSKQQPMTSSSGMYIPPVPKIASTNQAAGKSTKAYTAAIVPPAGLFVSSAESVRAVFVVAGAFLVMV
ncbi:hypothetical protein HDU80_004748 [Chytriomyces hyalinus]|nr:hypothetical protein HDU80_004748 [Chytriomyces hyalinus]